MILHGKIITSQVKAKAVQPLVEKLVTKAKKGNALSRRHILEVLPDATAADMLMMDAKDRFSQRTSGYTRIMKIGGYRKDGSREVILSFVDGAVVRKPIQYEKRGEQEKIRKDSQQVKTQKKPKKEIKKVKKSNKK